MKARASVNRRAYGRVPRGSRPCSSNAPGQPAEKRTATTKLSVTASKADAAPQTAICAVAASMLAAIYHMLNDGTEHRDLGANHFDRRAVDTKTKRLVNQLTKLGFQVRLEPLTQAP